MPKVIDLTGQQFGRLMVSERAKNDSHGNSRWNCWCTCKNKITVAAGHLRNGDTRSCGCLKKEFMKTAKNTLTHGMTATREYRTWSAMKRRCYNEKAPDYNRYGGRGITVCAQWRNSFEAFFEDMGPRPPETSINRLHNDGPYTKSNCSWATPKEQARNRRPRKKKAKAE